MSDALLDIISGLLLDGVKKTRGGISFCEVEGLLDQVQDAVYMVIRSHPANAATVGPVDVRKLVIDEFIRLIRQGQLVPNCQRDYTRLMYRKEALRLVHSKK